MGLEAQLRGRIRVALDALARAGELDGELARSGKFSVEPPRKGGSGDVATNVALALGKAAGKKPRDLAEAIASHLRIDALVREVEVAGPGFLNVSLEREAFVCILASVLDAGDGYGRGAAATGERINVEFVSANPTGPLLVSHGRGAVVGDAVARLLEAVGHRVTREYYINDFGNQIRLLAESVLASHEGRDPPEGGYGGWYVADLARFIAANRGELFEAADDAEKLSRLARQAVTLMLGGIPGSSDLGIRDTLARLGVQFDVWTSEESLHRWGRVAATLAELDSKGRLVDSEGARFFVVDADDENEKDRVVKKTDGNFTYFASDIAYHDDKIHRGFDRMIDVWGADHHGYIARTRAAIDALGHDSNKFEVLLFQLVSLLREGKPYKMGKRLGNLITIQEVQDEIDEAAKSPTAGADALRYFYLSRKVDTPIDLDIELAKKQGLDNPVFYVQYGHARLCSILRVARERCGFEVPPFTAALAGRIEHRLELDLLANVGRYPDVVAEAAAAREPFKLLSYLRDLAQSFQSYYTVLRQEGDPILPPARELVDGWQKTWDEEKTLARLLWVDALRTVYAGGLGVLGITAHERMERIEREEDAVD